MKAQFLTEVQVNQLTLVDRYDINVYVMGLT